MIRRKLKLWLAGIGLISAGTGVTADAQAQPAAPAAAPAAWIAYAVSVTDQLQAWMAEDSAPALLVMTDLVELQPASRPDQPVRLDVKLWIDPDGAVARVETSAGRRSGLEEDLAALVAGRKLGEPPPAGMALPIRLRLAIRPAAAGGV